MNYCLWCNKEIPEGRKFCSNSCITRFYNKKRVDEGTCNLLKKNGGSELARQHNFEMTKQGIHPFLKKNYSETTRIENGKKHSKWVIENQVANNKHPWQLRESRINNEYERELSIYTKKNIDKIKLYLAFVPDIENVVKIGVSVDLSMRERDGRFPILKPLFLCEGPVKDILTIEKEVKLKFSTEESFKKYESYEIFEEQQQTIIDFISKFNDYRKGNEPSRVEQ